MKVLIADDSAMSRKLLRTTLERWHYEVVEAQDGEAAWEILKEQNAPHIAVLDWVMPGITGPEVCRRVREHRQEPYTYILLLTSKNTKEETVEGMEAGADDYIVKPYHEHELQVRLRAGKRIIELQTELLNAREELRERAAKDLLTLLPNRSSIVDGLQRELARCHRDQRTVGIILLDLDHFKDVNDSLGHFAGDVVLRETATCLRSNMRPYDLVGRYGGEEFLVVLPNSDLPQTVVQAERIRARLSELKLFVDGRELNITASFGVTVSDGLERLPEQLIRVADEALYRAKNAGRNCVAALAIEESALRPV